MAVQARCCWCKSPFVLINTHYWCESHTCRSRQAAYSIGAKDQRGKWRYLYVPLPVQVNAEEILARVIRGGRPHKLLWGGAAGPGKSKGGRFIIYRRCLRIPNFEALILRETFPELERSHLRRMEEESEMFRSHGVAVDFIPSKFKMKFPNGSLIELGHMDDADAVRKYLSAEYDFILPDEAVKYDPRALSELIGRARSSKRAVRESGGPVFMPTSNPGGPSSSILRDLFIDRQPDFDAFPQLQGRYHQDEWDYVPANLEDNPYLDEDYESDLAINQPWRYKQLRHNDWDVIAGQFFDTFKAEFHVRDLGTPRDVDWFRSLDWGYINPGCVGFWACLPDGRLYRRSEIKFQHADVADVCRQIHERIRDLGIDSSRVRYTSADPSLWSVGGQTGEFINETFARNRVPLRKAKNERVNGWQRFREWLRPRPDGEPAIIWHPDCRYSIRTISSAVSDKHNPEDVDTSIDDHALDDTRYGLMSRPSPTRIGHTPPPPPGSAGDLLNKALAAAREAKYDREVAL